MHSEPRGSHNSQPKRRGVDGKFFALQEGEKWWRDQYRLLESRGYRLRDRLHPDWIPSWTKNPLLRPEDCEDAARSHHPMITMAIRISDGSTVCLKRLELDSQEAQIAVFLSSQKDKRNNCVPILDFLKDDAKVDFKILVMPLLREFFRPPFVSVEEIVDFIRQTLEGISYFHSKLVAHRDCSDLNIMLDGSLLYPKGFHAIYQDSKPLRNGPAPYVNRNDVQGVKYYFTDFGLSSHFTDEDESRLVTGTICAARVPELSDTVPYDPFAVDIYLLGDVYRRYFTEKYKNMLFLAPLIEAMIQRNPRNRPNCEEALKLFEELVSQQSDSALRWRLITPDMGRISCLMVDMKCMCRERLLIVKNILTTLPSSQSLRSPKSRLGRPSA